MMRADVKRDSYLLLAAALGRLGGSSWQLLVVGDGPARPEIAAALDRLGPARVAFAGAVPEAALAAYYAAADLYVWPALREAYGLAMLEAQAAGLPVVAGREGGVAEIVQDGVTGVLSPRDPAAFAEAVARLLERPQQRRAMGAAAARFIARERGLEPAAAILAAALEAARAIRAARS